MTAKVFWSGGIGADVRGGVVVPSGDPNANVVAELANRSEIRLVCPDTPLLGKVGARQAVI